MIDALPAPHDWIMAALSTGQANERAVLVLISDERGSTPRDTGSWVLVSQETTWGTVGGGEFERAMIEAAQAMLLGNGQWRRAFVDTVLGPDMRQCCGGVMQIMLQPIDSHSCGWLETAAALMQNDRQLQLFFDRRQLEKNPLVRSHDAKESTPKAGQFSLTVRDEYPRVALFGAGHVGRALCAIASQLPLSVTVFDSREEQLTNVPLARNIALAKTPDPLSGVYELDGFGAAIVMTHSHDLDFDLCQILLQNASLRYVGLIGSESKSHRFRKRLSKSGLHARALERLISPIGRGGPAGKEPGVIALAVLGELLAALQPSQALPTPQLMTPPAA